MKSRTGRFDGGALTPHHVGTRRQHTRGTLPCLASPANLAALLKLLNEGITVRLAAPYRGGVQPAYLCAILSVRSHNTYH